MTSTPILLLVLLEVTLTASPAPAQASRAADIAAQQAEKSKQLTAVETGRSPDPAAEEYTADTLIARRDAIGRAWLTAVNPVIEPAHPSWASPARAFFRRIGTGWKLVGFERVPDGTRP